MSFKTRVFAAFLALLLLSGCRGEAAEPRFGADEPHFEFEDVRTVISLLQMHFVDPVAEGPLVEAGCEAIDDFVDEGGAEPSTIEKLLRKGASRPSIRCDSVDTVDDLREIYEDAVDGGADPSALAVVTNVGITHSLGHSHTGFTSISADDASELRALTLGLSWIRRDGALLVWDVEAGSAASNVGLRPGDKVVAIDGVDVRGWRGITDPHDPLGLKVLRPDAAPFEVELSLETRKTFIAGRMLASGIAYLRITAFVPLGARDDETGSTLGATATNTIYALHDQRPQAWILDLRGNRGGADDMCTYISGLFGRANFAFERPYRREGRNDYPQVYVPSPLNPTRPMVVLVDGSSTSCSEIMAEALRQGTGAVIVGTKTPGYAEVGITGPVGDGSLHITIARVKIGRAGIDLEGVGVTPDHIIELDAGELARGHDAQLAFAVDLLRSVR